MSPSTRARRACGSTPTSEITRLRVVIADDGIGGAEASAGSGLRGLQERVATLGGRLELDSPAGGGTRLEAVFPLG